MTKVRDKVLKMKFEIFNDKGKIVFQCHQESCMPTEKEIKSMASAGYKFKIDGKAVPKKKLLDLVGEIK